MRQSIYAKIAWPAYLFWCLFLFLTMSANIPDKQASPLTRACYACDGVAVPGGNSSHSSSDASRLLLPESPLGAPLARTTPFSSSWPARTAIPVKGPRQHDKCAACFVLFNKHVRIPTQTKVDLSLKSCAKSAASRTCYRPPGLWASLDGYDKVFVHTDRCLVRVAIYESCSSQ